MVNKKHERLLTFFINSSGYLVPRSFDKCVKLSKTMHPYLLGKRDIEYFYNLEKSLYGIRASMEVLKNIVANKGKILFVSNLSRLKSRFDLESDINFIEWKRGSLVKSKYTDLTFLTGIEEEKLIEVHRKCLLLVGVGSSTMSKISYPVNLNIESSLLTDWFVSLLYISYIQGKRVKESSKLSRPIKGLLGKGKFKGPIKKNEV